jgi:hypothetical protein
MGGFGPDGFRVMADWLDYVLVFSTLGGSIAIAIGGGVAYYQLRELRRTRQTQVLADLGRRWDDPLLEEGRLRASNFSSEAELRDAIVESQEEKNDLVYVAMRVPNFFEDVGVLAEAGAIDLGLVDATYGSVCWKWWESFEPTIQTMREQANDRDLYRRFDDLANGRISPPPGPMRRLRNYLRWVFRRAEAEADAASVEAGL